MTLHHPTSGNGYNLRGNAGVTVDAPQMGAGNYPNPIEKRPKLAHSHPDRSTLAKARDVLPSDDLFFRLCELERQIDERVMRKQTEIAASSFRSSKVRRTMKIYVSNTWNESDGTASGMMSGSASVEEQDAASSAVLVSPFAVPAGSASWILRIEGRIESPASGATTAGRGRNSALAAGGYVPPLRKFSSFVRSLVVELGATGEIVEWSRARSGTGVAGNCDGFEIKRPGDAPTECRIHIQFDFAPERFRLAPELAALLNMQLATRPAVVVALWQYIKLHKLQESDEKKIINNDAALQRLFRVSKMSFSDIPVLMEPYLLPPEPVTIVYAIRTDQELHVSPVVVEVDVDVDDVKTPPRAFLSSAMLRDQAFYDARIRELLDALRASRTNHRLLSRFAADPSGTCQDLLRVAAREYETLVGDVPVTLEELQRADFYASESLEQAAVDFLSVNPRFLQF